MKVAFFGTPVFASKIFESIIKKHELIACVTTPDVKKGRGKKLSPSDVKKVAIEHNIEVFQPEKLTDEFLEEFKKLNVDIAVVVAYGKIIPESYLNSVKYGFVNVHASILPRWRGAAPIHRAVLAGDKKSGVSIMKMDKGLDTGDVYKILDCELAETETTGSLHDKLLDLGIKGILELLSELDEGKEVKAEKQDDSKATYAHKIKKEMAIIDWQADGIDIERQIRGLNPYPSAKCNYNGNLLKIYMANFIQASHNLEYGYIESASDEGIKVACKGGFINITNLQKAGSKAMPVSDFLRGTKINVGDILS